MDVFWYHELKTWHGGLNQDIFSPVMSVAFQAQRLLVTGVDKDKLLC